MRESAGCPKAVNSDRLLEEGQYWQLLEATAHDGGHQSLDKAAAVLAVGPEGALPPDDGSTQDAFGVIVRRLHSRDADEGPECGIQIEH